MMVVQLTGHVRSGQREHVSDDLGERRAGMGTDMLLI